jgi:hypothetical protein
VAQNMARTVPDMTPLGLVVIAAVVGVCAGAQVPVGGPNGQWTTGLVYAPINASVGDVLVSCITVKKYPMCSQMLPM